MEGCLSGSPSRRLWCHLSCWVQLQLAIGPFSASIWSTMVLTIQFFQMRPRYVGPQLKVCKPEESRAAQAEVTDPDTGKRISAWQWY